MVRSKLDIWRLEEGEVGRCGKVEQGMKEQAKPVSRESVFIVMFLRVGP
jgi:hypothetical protein